MTIPEADFATTRGGDRTNISLKIIIDPEWVMALTSPPPTTTMVANYKFYFMILVLFYAPQKSCATILSY